MPRRPRVSTQGLFFHVVNRAAKRTRLFDNAGDYEAFESTLVAALTRAKVALFAYCLMPNHWHLVISPLADGELSVFMHWLTTTHARRWQTLRGLDGQGAVYQGRFRSIPVGDDNHFLWVCRYVERNALRASLVERAEEWRWSSLWQACNNPDATWLANWPVCRPGNWIPSVNAPQTAAELDAFRSAVRKGEPFGEESWRGAVSAMLGLTARRRGRPPKARASGLLDK